MRRSRVPDAAHRFFNSALQSRAGERSIAEVPICNLGDEVDERPHFGRE